MLEHLAAWLGVPCPGSQPLHALVDQMPDFSNVVVHWTGETKGTRDAFELVDALRRIEPSTRSDVVTPPRVSNARGSVVARLTMRRRLTATGFEIDHEIDDAIAHWQENPIARTEGASL